MMIMKNKKMARIKVSVNPAMRKKMMRMGMIVKTSLNLEIGVEVRRAIH